MVLFYILASVSLSLIFLYYYLIWNYDYWKKQGILSPEKCLPFIGNMWKVILMQEAFTTLCDRLYKKGGNQCMVGFYQLSTPTLILRDPELVKKVLVTNFSSFDDNQIKLFPELDLLLSKNPFFSQNKTWKENRVILTNGFSSRKLKLMFSLLREVSSKFGKFLDRKFIAEDGPIEFELKDLISKYTGEVMTAVGMGVEGHLFEDKPLTFGKIITSIFNTPAIMGGFSQIVIFFLPRLAKFLKMGIISKKMDVFFRKSVKEILQMKKEEGGVRNDFLQIMMENEKSNEIDEELNLSSYLISLILDGHETTGSTLGFLIFQLASHPEVQEKVRQEIISVIIKYNEKWEYEALKDLVYLEQVLRESMRLNSVLGTIMKTCTYEIQLVGSDGLSCRLKPGNIIAISIHGLHRDPRYWPDPENFDPDRFSEQKKEDMHKFLFLPFGGGPRMCVGMRFAIMVMKMAIVTILKNYSLELSPKTKLPLKQEPASFFSSTVGGLWVFMRPLSKSS